MYFINLTGKELEDAKKIIETEGLQCQEAELNNSENSSIGTHQKSNRYLKVYKKENSKISDIYGITESNEVIFLKSEDK